VLTVFAGVPPVLVLVVTLDPRDELDRPRELLELLELLEPPLEPPLDEPPLELEPLDEPPLDEPPAPADPVPERRANLATPH